MNLQIIFPGTFTTRQNSFGQPNTILNTCPDHNLKSMCDDTYCKKKQKNTLCEHL